MKIKTEELTGQALDWAVAKAEGNVQLQYDSREGLIIRNILGWFPYRPSVAWQQGGPIIEREAIELVPDGKGSWSAAIRGGDEDDVAHGPTPLIAAMRCYVASRLGDEVDIPEELL
jgi:hypothetical protein